jgi:Na+/H+ antiporter NhaD/arsenite permease-like protein
MLIVITAVASALLDNVTTILLVAPVTVLLAERLGDPPVPFLIAEVMASNIGGTATLVGDPPNIIIGSEAGLDYLDFVTNLAPLVVVLIIVLIVLVRWLFRAAFVFHPERTEEVMALDEREALVPGPLLPRALAVLGVVTAAFVLQGVLHYEPSVVALLGAGVLLLVAEGDVETFLREIEGGTLLFFMGLFVMVGALVKVGVVASITDALVRATGGHLLAATLVLLFASGILSAIVDNIPYVATMAPIVHQLTTAIPGDATVLWWSLALGADLGGNATSIGASANVVALGMAERAGHPIRFVDFLKYGLIVAPVTLGVSALYVWFRYFLVG